MILRRVISHVKNQEWTAIGIDFLIVVFGVFVGLQVTDWNDNRKSAALEEQYLERLALDIRASVSGFSTMMDLSVARRESIVDFVQALTNPSARDQDLVEAAKLFFTDGWITPSFLPVTISFDDLASTGNFKIIQDTQLRDALIGLHNDYDTIQESFRVNDNWLLPNDSRIAYDYDVFRWDSRSAALYPDQSAQDAATDLRLNRDQLRRLAASHYWLHDRAIGHYENAITQSQLVLDLDDLGMAPDSRERTP